jgi:hypothetical protein
MLHTIDRRVTVPLPMDEVVEWCASSEARLCFPGARNVRGDGAGLFFEVKIAAPGAAPATVTVDEYLKDSGRLPHRYWFETSQVWTWPNRDSGISWHRYRFTERPDRTTLDFRWRYILPGLAGAQLLSEANFNRSIEKAAEIYVDRLARRTQPLAVPA